MESTLLSSRINTGTILSLDDYNKINSNSEFLLFGDNILEGISIMNTLIKDDNLLSFYGVLYHPIDEPIYVLKDKENRFYSIKICGAYDKWQLPQTALNIKEYIDLPDYILYSLKSKKTILAGENTETASVGNSQWQREGRKVAAAKNGVPFIYQTFYSGKDESQDTIREPNSLQVYNQLLYSIRYRIPSFVAYYTNNFEGSNTSHIREPEDSKELFSLYIKSVILADIDEKYIKERIMLEKKFFIHMISYLKEGKYSRGNIGNSPRIEKDFLIINQDYKNALISNTEIFVDDLINYIYNNTSSFLDKYHIDLFNLNKAKKWTCYDNKQWISDILDYLKMKNQIPVTYITGLAKVGIADKFECEKFLNAKFPNMKKTINLKLNGYDKVLLLPLRIHKVSNGTLTFSPDPESGEIVAFCELFGYDINKNKKMPVIGYTIVETPDNFSLDSKKDTKLYKALANYVDLLIINNSELYYDLNTDYLNDTSNFIPSTLEDVKRVALTEEVGVVSTFLNLSTIRAKWKLCFIHTHHSSWQQLVVFKDNEEIQHKIDRVSTKVDLIMQDKNCLFMLAEGKDRYIEILNDRKIQTAMKEAGELVERLLRNHINKFDAFVYNCDTVPDKDPERYVGYEVDKLNDAMKNGDFNDIAFHNDYVFIIVYRDKNLATKFKLVYSSKFNSDIKKQLDKEFNQ